jgi:nitrile hydratase
MHDHDSHDHHEDHAHGEILTYADDSRHDQNDRGRYELMAEAIRELLVEKGVIAASDIRERLEYMDSVGPRDGARIVARAWADPAYKARLLADANAAIAEVGIDTLGVDTVVVENTPEVHNLVVCTLCSCYPRTILGLPPDWYKSKAYRSRAVNQPHAVLREFGTEIAGGVTVRVHDSNADMRYLVLPERPAGTEGWSEDRLAELVTRDSMIGVSRAGSAA